MSRCPRHHVTTGCTLISLVTCCVGRWLLFLCSSIPAFSHSQIPSPSGGRASREHEGCGISRGMCNGGRSGSCVSSSWAAYSCRFVLFSSLFLRIHFRAFKSCMWLAYIAALFNRHNKLPTARGGGGVSSGNDRPELEVLWAPAGPPPPPRRASHIHRL
jgi:hypothetical protein